jgi:hypothetical protein
MKWRACCAHVSTYHGRLELLVMWRRAVPHRSYPFPLAKTLLPRSTPNKGFVASEAAVLAVAAAIAALCDELSLAL